MEIRKAKISDLKALSRLALKLWSNHTLNALCQELEVLLQDPHCCFLLAFQNEQPIGFAQCQLRSDEVAGVESSPVGYLEGIYIQPVYRRLGYASALVQACEQWVREMGCSEFASDCEIHHQPSAQFHLALGFHEVERVICFAKKLV